MYDNRGDMLCIKFPGLPLFVYLASTSEISIAKDPKPGVLPALAYHISTS